MKAQETSGEDATVEERTEFFFDKSWDRMIALLLPAEECLQLFGNNLIQQCCFGMAWSILKRAVLHAPAGGRCQANPSRGSTGLSRPGAPKLGTLRDKSSRHFRAFADFHRLFCPHNFIILLTGSYSPRRPRRRG